MPRTFFSAVALVVGLAFTGCTQTMEPLSAPVAQVRPDARMSAPIASANVVPHLSTCVRAGEREYAPGSVVPLVISATNHERVPVTVQGLGCTLLYIVYDQNGTQVSEGFTCGYTGDLFTFNAGETVHREMEWLAATPRYQDGAIIYVPLPPGLYRIHAYLVPNWPLHWDTYLSAPFVVRLIPSTRADGTSTAQAGYAAVRGDTGEAR